MEKRINFNELSFRDRALIIAEHGHYLVSTEYYDCWVHLYALDDLENEFVEVYYNIYTKQIQRISMPTYKELDKHLNKILIKIPK